MTTNEELEIASAYLPAATITELLAARDDLVMAGSGLPAGRARRADGGWVLDGRWRFVTGSPAADHLVVGSLVDDGTSRPPRLCYALFPAERAELVDTWHVDGLRGTGSGDVVVHGLFVPEAWTGVIRSPLDTVPDTTLYRLPSTLRFPIPKTAVAAGIARGAIEDFTALAGAKTPVSARSQLRERPDAARAVAEATALRAAGWAWVREVAEELWSLASAGEPDPPRGPRPRPAGRLVLGSQLGPGGGAGVQRRRFDRQLRRLAPLPPLPGRPRRAPALHGRPVPDAHRRPGPPRPPLRRPHLLNRRADVRRRGVTSPSCE